MIESLIDPLLSKKYVDCVILGKKSTKKINWIIRSNKACRWVRRKKSSLTNRPRLIYHYSNMAPKLSGIEEQKNFKKVAILTWKPRSLVSILIYQTWLWLNTTMEHSDARIRQCVETLKKDNREQQQKQCPPPPPSSPKTIIAASC